MEGQQPPRWLCARRWWSPCLNVQACPKLRLPVILSFCRFLWGLQPQKGSPAASHRRVTGVKCLLSVGARWELHSPHLCVDPCLSSEKPLALENHRFDLSEASSSVGN